MDIFHINTTDYQGGAAQVAYNLKQKFKQQCFKTTMLVSQKTINDNDILVINNSFQPGRLSQLSRAIIKKDIPSFIKFNIRDLSRAIIANDIEYFKCDHVLNLSQYKNADIIHCHNLHGNYFNLCLLAKISKEKPLVWTLHDMWSITGHCSHAYECIRWKNFCGHCPNLEIYPSLFWDNTNNLLEKKKNIYENSKLNIVVPSLWLRRKVEISILKNQNIYLIYNGIDVNEFKIYDKNKTRNELNLPIDRKIILFLASGGTHDPMKGWPIVKEIINFFKNKDILFLCIGNKTSTKETVNNVQYLEYIQDKKVLAKYFSTSDVFLLPSLAENFPLVILEAMACGTPVVSFDVGGVKEAMIHGHNGYIAKYKDIRDLINGIKYIFSMDDNMIRIISENSIERVKNNFSLEIMTDNYKKLYQKILDERKYK
jgi:glycosyltransferase involved in cell wall biosynthesis